MRGPKSKGTDVPQTKTLHIPKKKLTKGSTFANRYEIIEELGRGGMGRVYKALDSEISEEVAIKLLKPEIAETKQLSALHHQLCHQRFYANLVGLLCETFYL